MLESERSQLYDYALRMTGQVSRSVDAIDDAFQGLSEAVLADIRSLLELRETLYTMVRKFNADIWNADTRQLTNTALERTSETGTTRKDKLAAKESAVYRALDRSLRHLPGPEREAVILRIRVRLELPMLAAIMGLSEAEADANFITGMTKIDAECSGIADGPEAALTRLPEHPAPERSAQATMNLSEVMQGIKAKPVGLWSPVRFVFLILLGMLLGAWWFYPESLHGLSRAIKALVLGRGP